MAEELLKPTYNIKTLRVLDINENEIARLRWRLKGDIRTRWLLGSILDKDRMQRAMENVDVVFMLAAQKHVDLGEMNPYFSLQTNVLGAQICIESAIDANVDKYVYTSSDKAVAPSSTYGTCKKLAEYLTLDAKNYKGDKKTKFSVVRPCNYYRSDGCVTEIWDSQMVRGLPLTVTSKNMYRYFLSFDEIINFVLKATAMMQGGEIFVPNNCKRTKIYDLAKEYGAGHQIEITGLRPGEKLEELLMDPSEKERAKTIDDMLVIEP
jgi:FlaA1/EpsC-like NDP-sugar epimerase